MIEIFLSSFISLLVIVDPIGTSAVFSALSSEKTDKQRGSIALKATIISIILLIIFAYAGKYFLSQMGISFEAFQIAGGLLLFVTAFRMIMGFHEADNLNSDANCYKDNASIAIFPLAIPLLAGPGCMTAVILNMTEASLFQEKAAIIASIIIVQLLACIAMLTAAHLTKLIGDTGSSLLSRIMGIFLAALSVQFIADGIQHLFFT